MALVKHLALVAIGLLSQAACSSEVHEAKVCYDIVVADDETLERQFDYGRQLIPYFIRFADHHGLEASGESAGGAYKFTDQDRGIYVGLVFGMGERAAVADLYTDLPEGHEIYSSFRDFVVGLESQDISVVPCEYVDGRSKPVLIGVRLRAT